MLDPTPVLSISQLLGACTATPTRKDGPMSGSISQLSDATFSEEVNAATEPVLVDFWAEWCGPCKTIAPILEEIATEQSGNLRVAKVNVDDNQALALKFGVQSIPTMIVFKDGEEVHRIVGARGKPQLLQDLSAYL
jgi:thioredoxin 1